MPSLLDTLEQRGLVHQVTDEKIGQILSAGPVTVYAGFDPTADSLHLGHLVPIMVLAHFQQAGHKVLPMVGGATGMIGDPSFRSEERSLLTAEQVEQNVRGIGAQLSRFLDFDGENPARLLNNHDWIGRFSFIEWARDVGKYFTINYMLAKESVKQRLAGETGMSFTEFTYMTLQGYDFLHLFEAEGCTFQVGGSDQWGNITAGCDLVRKKHGQTVYAITNPLMTTAAGEKFGKSAGNAIWLDPDRTSPWDFYQYLIRQDDRDVIRFLNIYTFIDQEEIAELARAVENEPHKRAAQKRLAFEVTALVHGRESAEEMARAAEVVYGSEIKDLTDKTLAAVFADVPSSELSWADLQGGVDLIAFLAENEILPSKGQANRLLKSGGLYINNVRVTDEKPELTGEHLAGESFIVLRTGKKNYHLVQVKR
ncbi:MAG: tyrosine--tRNA ligase [Phycisphaerae bacterium]